MKKATLPALTNFIQERGYTNIKIERKVISFNVEQLDILSEDETHDVFMQFLSAAFVFGYIKGVRYQKGRVRVWLYFTDNYECYA